MNTYLYADLDQMVFEGRPQEYGAYVMRKRYNQLLMRATLITFLLFVSATVFPKVLDWLSPAEVSEKIVVVGPTLTPKDLPLSTPIEEDITEVPPLPPSPPKKVKTIAFLNPVATKDELIDDEATIAEVSETDTAAIGLTDQDGDDPGDFNYDFDAIGDGTGNGDVDVVLGEESKPTEIGPHDFIVFENEPAPVNMDQLKKLIGYPSMAKEADIQGKVILRILVDKYGNYIKHIVLKDPHRILTEAVARHIHQLKVTPGIQAGSPISTWVTVPFNFRLQ